MVISRASLVVASARMQNRRRRFSSHCCASCFLSASVGWPARLAHQPLSPASLLVPAPRDDGQSSASSSQQLGP